MPWLKKIDVPQWLLNTNTLSMRIENGEVRYFVSDIHLERDLQNHRPQHPLQDSLPPKRNEAP